LPSIPDLLVVAIDANCLGFTAARQGVARHIEDAFRQGSVIACPDPHVERWYMADPQSFHRVVGVTPRLGKRKCERDVYKQVLAKAVTDAGHPPTLGGIEFAWELVEAMDWFKAGKREPSFKHFLDDAREALRTL
jgi:hypothetical protein